MAQGILPVSLSVNLMDLRAALKKGISRLRAANVPSHTLAAELLLMHALGRDRTWLYTHPEALLDLAASEKYFALVARRASGEPTQYLTGKQEFWGLEFEVTPDVLIPRPETEHVIEVALERLGPRGIKINLQTGAPSPALRIVDVGTGSGCLAVALAHELPHAEIFATDLSVPALTVAKRNAARHGVADRIHFLESDLLGALLHDPRTAGEEARSFDLIVSNPPYVARNEADQLPREVRDHEPNLALFPGPTGVEIYARLIEQTASLLRPGGILVVELGYDSADHVCGIFAAQLGWTNVSLTNDLAGIPRVIAAERL
ncbi:MAG TPA: peptide chain release factor N(5)-glutamine methyltransferase [Candidatus Limnocylindria bacterium]|nr:peptide chain release factor N(5)-glutamine methyltransferase [Candidatus Limnocylindria bacterium]